MNSAAAFLLITVAILMGVVLAVVLVMYLIVPMCRAIGWIIKRIFAFIGGEIADIARLIGAIITSLVLVPLVLGTIVIGRWSASAHFGRAIQREVSTLGACIYRIFLGHPARLVGLAPLTEGLERRIPEVVRATPGADKPAGRAGQFEGYKIIGSLMGGGSGAKLYIAEPDPVKRAAFERQGFGDVSRVVIKSFSIRDGSTLPQIVRESRALDAARRLGFVLDHDLTPERFFYITRYVPGESLGIVTHQLHAASSSGLGHKEFARALKYISDLLGTLDAYHQGGLWHKDVKPDNIIVHDDTAHLVDLGLVTPLRSAMTLTTHGTEYFRDPEMVRMALKGVKVHQVDGARFDIYAVGAVLFSVVENSFPAHGGLSQISKRCPEAVRWIVRRAMADYDKRYPRAGDMLADLEAVRRAPDPFAVRPADLPSVRASDDSAIHPHAHAPAPDAHPFSAPHAPQAPSSPQPAANPAAQPFPSPAADASPHAVPPHFDPGAPYQPEDASGARRRPRLVVTDWFKGRYAVTGFEQKRSPHAPAGSGPRAAAAAAMATAADAMNRAASHFGHAGAPAHTPPHTAPRAHDPRAASVDARRTPRVRAIPDPTRRSAAEQVRAARERAAAARSRANARMSDRARVQGHTDGRTGVNPGMAAAVFGFIGVCVLVAGGIVTGALLRPGSGSAPSEGSRVVITDPDSPGESFPLDPVRGIPASLDPADSTVQSRIDGAIRQATERIVEMQQVFREAGALASVAAQSPGGTVIVVTDVLPPMTRAARASIEGATARMLAFGFHLVGSVPGFDVEGEELERQIDLIAQVRAARGQIPLDSKDAARTLSEYLTNHPEHGDAIIWIAPGEDRDEPTFYLFLGQAAGNEADRLRSTLETALSDPEPMKY